MPKNKEEITIRSSAAEYLTFINERAVQFRKWANHLDFAD